jgi:hypothetical protein
MMNHQILDPVEEELGRKFESVPGNAIKPRPSFTSSRGNRCAMAQQGGASCG